MVAKRKTVNLTGAAGAGTGYQVLLKVGESAGAVGPDFSLGTPTVTFPSGPNVMGDLAFRDLAGNLLNSWVEQVTGATPNRVAWVWVKVTANLSSDQSIECVYNLGTGAVTSDGTGVFELFDDFSSGTLDATKWKYLQGSGGLGMSGGEATLTGSGGFRQITSLNAVPDGREVLGRVYPADTTLSNVSCFGFSLQAEFSNDWSTTSTSEWCISGSTSTPLDTRYHSAYHRMQVKKAGGAASLTINGAVRASTASGVSTSDAEIAALFVYDSGSINKLDWIAVKKYQASEPVFGSASAEADASGVTISGVITDDAGANCARTVRAYRRDTGEAIGSTVSNASTGAYSITTVYSGAHVIVFLDDDSGATHNALVLDRILPA